MTTTTSGKQRTRRGLILASALLLAASTNTMATVWDNHLSGAPNPHAGRDEVLADTGVLAVGRGSTLDDPHPNFANIQVGIGTTTPGYRLDVNGALQLEPSLAPAAANGVVYYDAGLGKFRCHEGGAWKDCIGVSIASQDWKLAGNAGTTAGTDFIGTTDNQPLEMRANNARVARFSATAESVNVLEGFNTNAIAGGEGNTISGGGSGPSGLGCPCPNLISSTTSFHTIGGGRKNEIDTPSGVGNTIAGGLNNGVTGGGAGTIAGGFQNVISAGQPPTIGGGQENVASADWTTVAGGAFNTASGSQATVGGGTGNVASGASATVPGGTSNAAAGSTSLAAGNRAKANHAGAFVWSDNKAFNFPSTAADQFSVRSTGGARFVSAIDGAGNPTAGVVLPAGAGAWAALSDRASKENVAAVDGRDVLERLAGLSVSTWNWQAEEDAIRHMGPMAQDFHAAFGLGGDETRISTVDADGVSLAAIQGLYAEVQERDARIADLEERLDRLEGLALAGQPAGDGRLPTPVPDETPMVVVGEAGASFGGMGNPLLLAIALGVAMAVVAGVAWPRRPA